MFQRFGTPAVQSKTFEAKDIEFVRNNVKPEDDKLPEKKEKEDSE